MQQQKQEEYTLAISTHKREQAKIKAIILAALNVTKKPKMSLEKLRNKLGKKLKNKSISRVLIEMREQGY